MKRILRAFINSDFCGLIFFVTCLGIAAFVCCLPFAYLEGTAKQQILSEMHDVQMPWYRAVFVDIEVNRQGVLIGREDEE